MVRCRLARLPAIRALGSSRDRTLAASDWVCAAGLLAVAAVMRQSGLAPSSLWLDDAWMALVHRAEDLDQAARIGLTSPGFALVLRAWLEMTGFSNVSAQALPFLFATLTPPLVYLLGRRMGLGVPGALVAGAVLALSPVHVDYSVRVKPYAFDGLAATVILAAGWLVARRPSHGGRWYVLLLVAIAATVMSALVVPAVVGAFVAGWYAWLRTAAGGRRVLPPAVTTGTFGIFGALWYLVVLTPILSPSLAQFWSRWHVSSPGEAVGALAGVFAGLLPVAGSFGLAAGAIALVVVAWRCCRLTVLLVVPVLAVLGLAVLGRAPLGAGRSDILLYPGVALLLGAAIDQLPRSLPVWGASLALLGLVAVGAPSPASYPQEDVRPLVELVDQRMQPGDGLLVYPATGFAYGLYTQRPISLPASQRRATRFSVEVEDPAVAVLPAPEDDLRRFDQPIEEAISSRRRVWVIASHLTSEAERALDYINASLREHGLRRRQTYEGEGAVLVRWSRQG